MSKARIMRWIRIHKLLSGCCLAGFHSPCFDVRWISVSGKSSIVTSFRRKSGKILLNKCRQWLLAIQGASLLSFKRRYVQQGFQNQCQRCVNTRIVKLIEAAANDMRASNWKCVFKWNVLHHAGDQQVGITLKP